MFGTLVSTRSDGGRLEFVENTDPITAVSRNVQDQIHVSCMFCRSRKAKCSGEREGCQRCIAMEIECVYPKAHGQTKRRTINQSIQRTRRNINEKSRTACNESEPCFRSDQVEFSQDLPLNDLHNVLSYDSGIDDTQLLPWMTDSLSQYSPSPRSDRSSSGNPTQNIHLKTNETSKIPSEHLNRSSSITDSAGSFKSLEDPQTTNGEIDWTIDSDRYSFLDSGVPTSSLNPSEGVPVEAGHCACLLSSVSFLESLMSRTTSYDHCIDRMLTEVRNSMKTLATLMACKKCEAQVEQSVLLAMMARQISNLCEKATQCYKGMFLKHSNTYQQDAELDASATFVDISVSTYRVTPWEGLHVLRSLITIHVRELQHHIDGIKARHRDRSNQGKIKAIITEADNHIKSANAAFIDLH